LIKKHLNGANIEEIKKEAETLNIFIPPSTDPIKISPISTAPEVIRRIWNQQVERFIREGKAKEFYAACNPRSSLPYQSFETNINSLYQQLFDRLGFNHRVENIQQLAQVAQIVVS
jgi:hypothetical protein